MCPCAALYRKSKSAPLLLLLTPRFGTDENATVFLVYNRVLGSR